MVFSFIYVLSLVFGLYYVLRPFGEGFLFTMLTYEECDNIFFFRSWNMERWQSNFFY